MTKGRAGKSSAQAKRPEAGQTRSGKSGTRGAAAGTAGDGTMMAEVVKLSKQLAMDRAIRE